MMLSVIAMNTRVSYTVETMNMREKRGGVNVRKQYFVIAICAINPERENAEPKEAKVANQSEVKNPTITLWP